jgi:hypothetical protein
VKHERWVIIPDLQVPLHDMRFVHAVCEFIDARDWTGLCNVGDEADCTEVGRWVKGRRGEYSGNLQKALDQTHDVLAMFRAALGYDKPYLLSRSNHTDRISHYLSSAPALDTLRDVQYQHLVGLDELDITWCPKPTEFTQGWLLAHGDEGGSSRVSGSVAMGLARRWGKSVVCGHTHKAAIQHDHLVVNGKIQRHLFGVETGHGMDLKKASYLKAGYGNWQQAITIIDNGQPMLLPVINGQITGAESIG